MVIGQRNRSEREKSRSIGEGGGFFRLEVEEPPFPSPGVTGNPRSKIVTEMRRGDSSTSDIFLDENKSHKGGGLAMKGLNLKGRGTIKDYELMVSAYPDGMKSVIFDTNCDMKTDEGTLSM